MNRIKLSQIAGGVTVDNSGMTIQIVVAIDEDGRPWHMHGHGDKARWQRLPDLPVGACDFPTNSITPGRRDLCAFEAGHHGPHVFNVTKTREK